MNGLFLKIHPVYDQYAASRCGKVVNLDSEAILLGTPDITNKLSCSVRSKNIKNRKSMQLLKFVYECFHGLVPNGMTVKHIDGDCLNNKISNLELKPKSRKRSVKYVVNPDKYEWTQDQVD